MKTLMLLALLASPALADDLIYQSQTLSGTTTFKDGGEVDPEPDSDAYLIDVTVSGPLAPNLQMAVITPTGWTVTCTHCLSQLSNPASGNAVSVQTAVFMFSTDATGKITAWNFSISDVYNVTPPPDPTQPLEYLSLSNGGFTGSASDTATGWQYMNGHQYIQSLTAPHGGWTQSSLANPAPAVTTQLRTCSGTWGPVSNNVPAGVTANASGAGLACTGALKGEPGAYYTKVTTDGGKTFSFVQLKSLGLGNGK